MIEIEALQSLINSGEGYKVEFKVRIPSKVRELTEEICVTGIVSFFLPSGINVRIVFGTLRVKKFCSVEISPFK